MIVLDKTRLIGRLLYFLTSCFSSVSAGFQVGFGLASEP